LQIGTPLQLLAVTLNQAVALQEEHRTDVLATFVAQVAQLAGQALQLLLVKL